MMRTGSDFAIQAVPAASTGTAATSAKNEARAKKPEAARKKLPRFGGTAIAMGADFRNGASRFRVFRVTTL
jgi:hypothetical protein